MTATPIETTTFATEEAVRLLNDYGIFTDIMFDPEFRIDQIGSSASTKQVRSTLLDDDHVKNLTAAMKADIDTRGNLDRWPAILVWKPSGSTKYDVLNGLHRIKSAKNNSLKKFPAVIVDLSKEADPATKAQILKIAANLTNGLPMSNEDRMQNALHLSSILGVDAAAKVAGIHPTTLRNYEHKTIVTARFVQSGLTAHLAHFTQQSLLAVGKIKNQPIFRESIELAVEADMTNRDAVDMFERLVAIGDETSQKAEIARTRTLFSNQIAAKAAGVKVPKAIKSPGVKVREDLHRLVDKRLAPDTILGLYTTPVARIEAITDLQDLVKSLEEAIATLAHAEQRSNPAA